MRYLFLLSLLCVSIKQFGQSFYFTRQSSTDTLVATAFINFPDRKLLKTKSNHLIVTYHLSPPEIIPTATIRYIKIDTTGNIKWKKSGGSDKLYEILKGDFIGNNYEPFTTTPCLAGKILNYYDSSLNFKWKKCFQPSSNSKILSSDAFNYLGGLNNKTHFRSLFYDYNFPQTSNVFVTGTLDTTGITVIKNEPFIYTSDSLQNDLDNYNIHSELIGNYNSQTYFLNYGNWFNGEWWSNNKVYSFAYISSFDSVLNKFNYRDIKVDSLWAINGAVRISNNSFIIYGSRAYQPYIFKTDFNGTIYWAKKINIQQAVFGPRSFLEGCKFKDDKFVFNYGDNNYSDLFTYSTMLLDTMGNIVSNGKIASGDGKGNLYNIQDKIYSIESFCKSIQIFKSNMQDSVCGDTYTFSGTINDKLPVLYPLQLTSSTNYSIITNNLSPIVFPINTDTLVRTFGCVSPCIPQSIPTNNIEDRTFNLYPNPCDRFINIDIEAPYSFKLYNTDGKKLIELNDVKFKQIDVSAYPKGLYFIIIENSKNTYKEKLIKEE